MSKHPAGFDFAQWVPGFDFLQQVAQAHAAAQPQMHPQGKQQAPPAAQRPGGSPAWAQWLAPTLDPQEAARRIQELKTVLFWLEQNATALKATIQALEVQQLTCQTLKDMQAHWMGQVASASESGGAQAAAPESATAQAASPAASDAHPSTGASDAEANVDAQLGASAAPSASAWQDAAAQAGQWWGSLLHTFGQIAQQAQQEVAQRQAALRASAGPRSAEAGHGERAC